MPEKGTIHDHEDNIKDKVLSISILYDVKVGKAVKTKWTNVLDF